MNEPSLQTLRSRFWERYSLEQLNATEWEALCDGCGLCCLVKLMDDDTEQVVYTKLACKLLDTQTGHCSDYANRKAFVPDCLQLDAESVKGIDWLPSTCGYMRMRDGKPLADWHPLISGTHDTVLQSGKSVAGRCMSEEGVAEEDWEDYLVKWVTL